MLLMLIFLMVQGRPHIQCQQPIVPHVQPIVQLPLVQQPANVHTTVVVMGGCPSCRVSYRP